MQTDEPIRANHRFMSELLLTEFKDKKILPEEGELDKVSSVFQKMGGSWEKIFKGSSFHINLLRQVITAAISQGVLTKKPSWE